MDDLSKKGDQERARIDINEEWERRYWTGKLGVTEDELQKAVDKVGVMSKDVEAYFTRHKGNAHHS